MNFARYPSGFGSDKIVLSDDLVVSNVDLAATIFDLVDATVPDDYVMDGTSWLDEVMSAVDGDDDTDSDGDSCCEHRFIDIKNSRSIVTAQYQYLWRANDDVEAVGGVDDFYPSAYDEQQLYDLDSDPNEKVNLIADYESFRDDDSDGSLSSTITSFQSMMKDYVESTCPREDGECDTPSYSFCTETLTKTYWFFQIETLDDATKLSILEEAEGRIEDDFPDCTVEGGEALNYWYLMTEVESSSRYSKVTLNMEVCCGDDGAIFPGDYSEPDGYSYSGDAVGDVSAARAAGAGDEVAAADDIVYVSPHIGLTAAAVGDEAAVDVVPAAIVSADGVGVGNAVSLKAILFGVANLLTVAAMMLLIGYVCGRQSIRRKGGMIKLEGIPSSDESDGSDVEDKAADVVVEDKAAEKRENEEQHFLVQNE